MQIHARIVMWAKQTLVQPTIDHKYVFSPINIIGISTLVPYLTWNTDYLPVSNVKIIFKVVQFPVHIAYPMIGYSYYTRFMS